jgi:CHASE3 domain sensor protein
MTFTDISIGRRLAFGFGLVLILLIAISICGYWGVSATSDTTIKMLQGDASVCENAGRARANVIACAAMKRIYS